MDSSEYIRMTGVDEKNAKNKRIGTLNDTKTYMPTTEDDIKSFNYEKKSVWRWITFRSAKKKGDNDVEVDAVPYYKLFKYATVCELTVIFFGVLLAIFMGFSFPLMNIIYGEFTSLLIDRNASRIYILNYFGGGRKTIDASDPHDLSKAILEDSFAFGYAGLILSLYVFSCSCFSAYLLNCAALRQIDRIRKKFFKSALSQEISWYDTYSNMNFASRMTDDLEKLNEGIGEKITLFVNLVSSTTIGLITAFIYGWELTLIICASAPFLILSTAFVSKLQGTLTMRELEAYGGASSIAEEVFGSIRTVVAFSGEEKESQRFSKMLVPATKQSTRKGFLTGIGTGILWLITYSSYALAIWFGVKFVIQDRDSDDAKYTTGVFLTVFFSVLLGATNLGIAAPYLEIFATAKGSAAVIFSIIDRASKIDTFSSDGLQPNTAEGNFEFKNVHFQYPARPDVKILQGFNLTVKKGETVALVGPSGCGKSTAIQLLQRLYDPIQGQIFLDGTDIKKLNVKWYRQHFGVVGQEPVLFNATIGTNIGYGLDGATQADIENAAKQANCHDFISKLPDGYETMISNAQLSGGQKQRIAIARALIRNPKILLLDEATSALDLKSEAQVQKTLEKVGEGRTTFIVAHRLSTVTNADRIVFVDKGVVWEIGTHAELMELKGQYYNLVITNTATPNEEKPEDEQNTQLAKFNRQKSFAESVKSAAITDMTEAEEVEEYYKKSKQSVFLRVLLMNKPEWIYLAGGLIASICVGGFMQSFGILFGKLMAILAIKDNDLAWGQARFYSLVFVLIGFLLGLSTFFQAFTLNKAGAHLTTRLREKVFRVMMSQEMGWFDEPKNSVGALSSRLSGDISTIQSAVGTCVGAIFQCSFLIIIGVVVAFVFCWKLGIVCSFMMPFILISVCLEQRAAKSSGHDKRAIEDATKIAVEAISNIRTVMSLGQEQTFLNKYGDELANVERILKKKINFRAAVYGFGQGVIFALYTVSLTFGGYLIAEDNVPVDTVILVTEVTLYGSYMVGQALSFATNFIGARMSAIRIFQILDRQPEIVSHPASFSNDNKTLDGNIKYKDIKFRYPTRQNVEILKGLNLNVQTGQHVALVGFSGCGKSTLIQLLQRLYDPDAGIVSLDGHDTKNELSLPKLRNQLGIVSQEPVLFDRTIAENIAYGDNSREPLMSEIIEVAKQANIHNFINSLPLGYDTRLGAKGTQLSGGQKQRIAIARALIRQPKVLLLDEATSALDRESEKVVQEALDKAQENRTSITIAHRLVTIQNADVICVVDKGVIAEKGTHEELLAKKGLYYNLHSLSSIEH